MPHKPRLLRVAPRTSVSDLLGSLTVFVWVPVPPLCAARKVLCGWISLAKHSPFSEFILLWA